jgi:hypothetical protein
MNMDTKIIKAICTLIMTFGAIGPWISITLYGILKISYGMMLAVIVISVIATFATCEIYDQMTMIESKRK